MPLPRALRSRRWPRARSPRDGRPAATRRARPFPRRHWRADAARDADERPRPAPFWPHRSRPPPHLAHSSLLPHFSRPPTRPCKIRTQSRDRPRQLFGFQSAQDATTTAHLRPPRAQGQTACRAHQQDIAALSYMTFQIQGTSLSDESRIEPDDDGRDDHQRAVVGRALLIACGESAPLLEPIDAALDDVATGIDRLVKGERATWPGRPLRP